MRPFILLIILTLFVSCKQELPTDFSFLLGSWKMTTSDTSYILESWQKTDAQHYNALNYVVSDSGGMQLSEEIEIAISESGTYYKPTIEGLNGDKPFMYKYVAHQDGKYVFENKEYDFPRKIWYKIIDTNNLQAGIENESGDKKETFIFKRVQD